MRRLLKFLFGAAIGASAAMLVTPKTGREVRERLLGPEVRKLMPASLAELLAPPEPPPVWPSEGARSAYETATAVAEPEAGVAVAEPEPRVEPEAATAVAEPEAEAEEEVVVAEPEGEAVVAEPKAEAEPEAVAAVTEPAAAGAEEVAPSLAAEGAVAEERSVVEESSVAEEPAVPGIEATEELPVSTTELAESPMVETAEGPLGEAVEAPEAGGAAEAVEAPQAGIGETLPDEATPAAEPTVEEPEMAAWSEGGVAEAEAPAVSEGTAELAEAEHEAVAAPEAVEEPAVTTSQVPMSEEDLRAHIERTKEALAAELEKPFAVASAEPVASEATVTEEATVPEEATVTQPIGEAVASAEPAEGLAPVGQPEVAEVAAQAEPMAAATPATSPEPGAAAAPVMSSEPSVAAVPAEPVAEAPGSETVVETPGEAPPVEQAHAVETTAAATPESATEVRGEVSIDQAEMRRRIEETRARLKAKAFDAMMKGESALLAHDSGEKPVPRGDDLPVDHDVASSLEESLSPEDE